jgi:hypothetical protein
MLTPPSFPLTTHCTTSPHPSFVARATTELKNLQFDIQHAAPDTNVDMLLKEQRMNKLRARSESVQNADALDKLRRGIGPPVK